MTECNYRDLAERGGCGPAVCKSWYKQTQRTMFFCERCYDVSARLSSNINRIYEPLQDNTGLVLEFLVLWARQVRTLA